MFVCAILALNSILRMQRSVPTESMQFYCRSTTSSKSFASRAEEKAFFTLKLRSQLRRGTFDRPHNYIQDPYQSGTQYRYDSLKL